MPPSGKRKRSSFSVSSRSTGNSGSNDDGDERSSAGASESGGGGGAATFSHTWNEDQSQFQKNGKRFTKAEDDLIKSTFDEYCVINRISAEKRKTVSTKGAAKEGIGSVWSFIAAKFSDRSVRAVMRRAERILHPGNYRGPFSDSEKQQLQDLVNEHGPKWRELGDIMNRFHLDLKTLYERLIHAPEREDAHSQGRWLQEEEDNLEILVRAHGTRTSDGGYANIPWSIIGNNLGTRSGEACSLKWSQKGFGITRLGLTWSPDVDAQLLRAISECDADGAEEVSWHLLVPGRTGPACRERFEELRKSVPPATSSSESFDSTLQRMLLDVEHAAAASGKQRNGRSSSISESVESSIKQLPAAGAAVTTSTPADEADAAKAAKREKKRKRREAAEAQATSDAAADAIDEVAAASAAAAAASSSSPTDNADAADAKAAKREKKRKRREAAEAQAASDAADAVVEAAEANAAEAKAAKWEKKRMRREAAEAQAASDVASAAAVAAADEANAAEAKAAKREQKRKRREAAVAAAEEAAAAAPSSFLEDGDKALRKVAKKERRSREKFDVSFSLD